MHNTILKRTLSGIAIGLPVDSYEALLCECTLLLLDEQGRISIFCAEAIVDETLAVLGLELTNFTPR